jgi:CheY-like chemotaxis protein
MNILVIDDEDMILGLTQRILERGGHRVMLAGSGPDGLALMKKGPDRIALAVIDMSMQGMSGLETLAALRQCRPSLPAIISTGYATDDAELSVGLSANTYFLQKPYKSEDLLKAVERALATSAHMT